MKLTKNMVKLFFLYLISFFSFVMATSYLQTYLDYLGYSVLERGILLSGSAIVAIVGQFFIGYLCDKYQSDKKFYNLSVILYVLFALIVYSISTQMFFLHLLFISLLKGMSSVVTSVQDTWCLETDDDCMQNYGPIRAFGALGFMLGLPVGSFVIAKFGYEYLGIVFAVLSIFNIGLTFFMQDAQKHEKSKGLKLHDIKILLADKKFMVVTLMFLIINIISAADIYTAVEKMMMMGADEAMIGMRWSIQTLMELPLFFAGAFLLKKFGDYKLLMFGVSMYIIRFLCYALASTPALLTAATVFQLVTYPLIMITSKTFVDNASPSYMRATGQTVSSAFYLGVSSLITPILAGALATVFGINVTLVFIGLLGIIPLWLLVVYKRL